MSKRFWIRNIREYSTGGAETRARQASLDEGYSERVVGKWAKQIGEMFDHFRGDFEPVLRALRGFSGEVVIDRQSVRTGNRFQYRV